jgi:hypothetical protein
MAWEHWWTLLWPILMVTLGQMLAALFKRWRWWPYQRGYEG